MTKRLSYQDKLKHPNWQRRRLEVLEIAGFACSRCGDTESTLHVHHKHYVKGREVWEYGDDELAVLCESCHQDAHDSSDTLSTLLFAVPEKHRLNILGVLSGAVYAASGDGSTVNRGQSSIDPLMVMAGIAAFKCGELDLTGMDRMSEFLKVEIEKSKERLAEFIQKNRSGIN